MEADTTVDEPIAPEERSTEPSARCPRFGLFGLLRFLTRSQVRILCYHGGNVGDEDQFNPLLFCDPLLLESRIEWLQKKGFTFVSLDDALTSLRDSRRTRPRLPVVVTFDDGWHSTYATLDRVLHRHRIPATLYVCTGYVARGWPNIEVVISYLLWKTREKVVHVSGFDGTVDGTHDVTTRVGRRSLTLRVMQWMERHCSDRSQACEALERLGMQLYVPPSATDLGSLRFDFVSASELRALADRGWSIQLHGHSHDCPFGRPQELADDIQTCRREIRQAGLPDPAHYCYPSGDYDGQAAAALAQLGVHSAVTCHPGLVQETDGEAVYYLPRLLDGANISAIEFESEMSGFGNLLRSLRRKRRKGGPIESASIAPAER